VLTTPFTFIATPESVAAAGARPVFCDISPVSYNLDAGRAAEFLEENCEGGVNRKTGGRVKAVMPAHLFGLMADCGAFAKLRERHGVKLVEDNAQSFGARMTQDGGEKIAGTIGDISCFSFFPSKSLGGAGDGGMILTGDEEAYERAKILHLHGAYEKYHHSVLGYNSRLDTIQAAILLIKLKHVDRWLEMRRENAAHYMRLFREKFRDAGLELVFSADLPPDGKRPEGALALPSEPQNFTHTYNLFSIRLPRRDEACDFLKEKGIGNAVYYPKPLHVQEVFRYLGVEKGSLPVSETVSEDIMSIPLYPELGRDAMEYIVDSLVEFLKK
ncbi:MAG: DegT/DnrJ/EryC1/StrS family aminotransferase, partial [bacterium]